MDENMDRNQYRSSSSDDDKRGGSRNTKFRKRICKLCSEKASTLDYKKTDVLVKYVSNKGKILPRRLSGSCAKHQRVVAGAIKRARSVGFMPYSAR